MKTTVFLSYSSAQSEAATRIELALKGEGYSVFRDRSALPPGESFDARIRAAIEDSDLFVFLISRESVSEGHYTLTELRCAEQKWGHPAGRVLPVFAEPTPKDAIPAFLRAVTILQPRGDIAAEVAAEVGRLSASWWRRMLEPRRLVPTVVVVLILAGAAWMWLPPYLERREQNARAETIVKQSQSQADSGQYGDAWKLLEQARVVAPASPVVSEAQERLAMKLIRNAGLRTVGETRSYFENLLNTTVPVLSRGASGAKGERLASLLAHLGWADYLRERTGVGGPDPAQHYRGALEVDPGNVYAHAMWGFEILRKPGPQAVAEAKRHFAAAAHSRRELEYVRYLEIFALLQIADPEREREVIQVANEMRTGGETRPTGWGLGSIRGKVWSIYHFGFVASDAQAPLLAALPPTEHLSTFQWWFPEDDLPEGSGAPSLFNFLLVLAQLQERAGDRASALASYRRLLSEFEKKKYDSPRTLKIVADARASIRRLSS